MRWVMLIIQLLAFLLVALGLMFRIMHWPGSTRMLVAGIAVAVIWFLLAFFFPKRKKESRPDILDADLDS